MRRAFLLCRRLAVTCRKMDRFIPHSACAIFYFRKGCRAETQSALPPPASHHLCFWLWMPPPAQLLVSTSILLSPQALKTLERIQPTGWIAIPIRIVPVQDAKPNDLVSDIYHLIKADAVNGFVDTAKSELEYKPTEIFGQIVEHHHLSSRRRTIAVRKSTISHLHLWRSGNPDFIAVNFVSDNLKVAWCEMGMNPAAFEPCIDI